MAASVLTIDTGEWVYLDPKGDEHVVTNAQSFSMTVTDGGASTVEYNVAPGETMTTTDGYTLTFNPRVTVQNIAQEIHFMTDAGQGSAFHNRGGELDIICSSDGKVQHWRVATITPSDADFGSAGTLSITLEDQYGNRMVLPSTGSGITVAQAA